MRTGSPVGNDPTVDPDARDRWSHLAHRDRRLCSPVDDTRLTALLQMLVLPSAPYVVDLGCGKGEALRLVVDLHGGTGTGVDRSVRMLGDAGANGGSVEFVAADATSWRPERTPDVAICMGSTHIFGGTAGAAAALGALVRPGGVVVLGDGYWRSVPAAVHLRAFGMEVDELAGLDEMVASVDRQNLVPVAVQPSTEAEWDDYEWSLIRAVELWALEHPNHPDVEPFRSRTRVMRDTFLEWRRTALGFALVVAVKPRAGAVAGSADDDGVRATPAPAR